MFHYHTGGIGIMAIELDVNSIRMIAGKIDLSVGELVKLIGIKAWTSWVFKQPVGNPSLWNTKAPDGYVGGQSKFSINMQYGRPDTRLPVNWGGGVPNTPSIKAQDDYQVLYVTSSIPYMKKLEEEGHSTQGSHMIKRTIGELNLELKTALR